MEEIDFSVFFHTKAQANDFLIKLSSFSEEIYKNDFNLEKSLSDSFGVEKKDKFVIFLRNNNVNTASTADIKNFLDKLAEKITKLPVLSLTLAFEPNEQTLNILNEWFVINIKKQFIFDISINPNLIAGVVLNFNGKFLDYSINQKFDQILNTVLTDEAKNLHPTEHRTATNVISQS
jgi:F0F1-type ATP synthase delta subunit